MPQIVRFFLLLILSGISLSQAQSPILNWAHMIDMNLQVAYNEGLCTDDAGNLYIGGCLHGSLDADPGPGVFTLTSTPSQVPGLPTDVYIIKLNPAGQFIWAKMITGGSLISDGGMVVKDDYLYLTGLFRDSVDFDPGPGTFFLDGGPGNDVFTLKMDLNGNLIWAKSFGAQGSDIANSIAVDNDGNVFTHGHFQGVVDFDPGPGVDTMGTPNVLNQMFVQKLDSAGNYLWARYTTGGAHASRAIAVDDSGHVFMNVISQFGPINFEPSNTNYLFNGVTCTNPGQIGDVFIAKYNSAGSIIWVKEFGGCMWDRSYDIDVTPNGLIYLYIEDRQCFNYAGNQCNNQFTESMLLKLDNNGDTIWSKVISSNLQGAFARVIDLDVNDIDQLHIIGNYGDSINFGTGNVYNSSLDDDAFIAKFDSNGNPIWSQTIGSASQWDRGWMITSTETTAWVLGIFEGTVDFDAGPGVHNLQSTNGIDMYVMRTGPACESFDSIVVNSCTPYTVPSGNATYSLTGTYFDTLTNYIGCDSILTIELIGQYLDTVTITACDSFQLPGTSVVYSSGTYFDTLASQTGCDSVIVTQLTINTTSYDTINTSSCLQYTFPSGGQTVNSSGTYTDTLINAQGCDSILTIHLVIDTLPSGVLTVSTCDSVYVSPSGSYTWNTAGTYLDTISNSTGCDSALTIHLTFLQPTQSNLQVSSCAPYVSPSGQIFTNSGTYLDTLVNNAGCDSIITLNLNILPNSFDTISVTTCDSFTAPSGKVWNVSGSYIDTLSNSNGCDSLLTIQLTILSSTSASITTTSCSTYVTPSGKILTTTGTYFDTIPNAAGCDSVITINLTIVPVNVSVTQSGATLMAQAGNASFSWLECVGNGYNVIPGETNASFTPAQNGDFAVEVTQNGCVDTSLCINVINVGVNEIEAGRGLVVFPNPNSGRFMVEVPLGLSGELSIFSGQGQIVYQSGNTSQFVDVNINTSSGFYMIRFVSGTRVYYQSVVIK